jgi:ABC-type transport system involved in multi-copper enzyme maturation permease subunit
MSTLLVQLIFFSLALFFVQGIAAIPWLIVLTRRPLREHPAFYAKVVGGVTAAGFLYALNLNANSDPDIVSLWGRLYGSILVLQVGIDLFLLTFYLLLTFWSKGGAVALAAFQEAVRQPMFWMLTGLGSLAMLISIVIPYFTFGEDLKMVKEISYALTMMFPAIFGVISASTSVAEEIEGRTAVTLLSKPVTRREFLFGKFLGVTLAGLFMTMFMGWAVIWVVLAKAHYDFVPGLTTLPPDPGWLQERSSDWFGRTTSGELFKGIVRWLSDTGEALPGLIIGFGQVMTLIAVSVALATRVPMVVNISMCLVVYFLGHLTPIMTEVSQKIALVHFFAQLFELLFPSLDLFDIGTAIIREVPLDPGRYAVYTLNVALYAMMYTAIAILAGLILFEDRDVA